MGNLFHCSRQWKATGVSVSDDFNFLWEVGGGTDWLRVEEKVRKSEG